MISPVPKSSPSWWASIVGACVGLALAVFAVLRLITGGDHSLVFLVALLHIGAAEMAISYFALRGHRAAWAFALSLNGTLCLVTLVGAPKLRDASGLPILVSLVPCAVFGVVAILHTLAVDHSS